MTLKTYITTYVAPILTVLTLAVFTLPVNAQTTASPANMNPNQTVDTVLCSMGMGCYSTTTVTATTATSTGTVAGTTTNSGSTKANSVTSSSSSSGGIWNFFFGNCLVPKPS